MLKPKRGEVWWVQFGHGTGSEIYKDRPAVVISNNISNKYSDRFQVIPLTSNVNKLYPGDALVTVKNKKGRAMTNQLTTTSIKRFRKKYSKLNTSDMASIEKAVKVQLDLI